MKGCLYKKPLLSRTVVLFHNCHGVSGSEGKKILPFLTVNPDTQPTITCSKLTIETLEQGVKHVQS